MKTKFNNQHLKVVLLNSKTTLFLRIADAEGLTSPAFMRC